MMNDYQRLIYLAQEERDALRIANAPSDVVRAADEVITASRNGTLLPEWAAECLIRYSARMQSVNRYGRANYAETRRVG